MIKIGDKVKFLNDVGGGIVTGFISKTTVKVENEDGFEIPYPISQLLNTRAPELNIGQQIKSKVSEEKEEDNLPAIEALKGEQINGKNSPDFYFCFVPSNKENILEGDIELYLVNDSNYIILFHFHHITNEGIKTIKHGTVQSNSRIKLQSLVQNDLSNLPDFGFQLLYFRDESKNLNEPVAKIFKINPVKFYKESTFQPNSFFKKNGMILQITPSLLKTEVDKLTPADLKRVFQEKEVIQKKVKKVRKRTAEEVEIDLHINELLDNTEGLSNREMLEIQMEKVESEMKLAIQSQVNRIVFIHGVGQGVLKQEVTNLLKSKFKKYYFQDASFKEYGYGATMVILKR